MRVMPFIPVMGPSVTGFVSMSGVIDGPVSWMMASVGDCSECNQYNKSQAHDTTECLWEWIQRMSQCKGRRERKQQGRKQLWSRKERRKITKKEKRAQKGFSCSFFSSLGPRLETWDSVTHKRKRKKETSIEGEKEAKYAKNRGEEIILEGERTHKKYKKNKKWGE